VLRTRRLQSPNVFSSSQCYTKSFTLAHVKRQWQLKRIASATTPAIFRVVVRPTDERELARRKFNCPLRFGEYIFRPWARVSRHDAPLLVQLWVQGRSETTHPRGACTPGNFRIPPSVYDRYPLRSPPPGDIHPQCADSDICPRPHRPGGDHGWRQRIPH